MSLLPWWEIFETIFLVGKIDENTKWTNDILPQISPNKIIEQTSLNNYKNDQNIPPALWATGGLAVMTNKLPLSLPSPRALDPAPLDHPRVYITFSLPCI